MTFYLSRYVFNNDIKTNEFVDALREYLMVAVRDPSNNIAELDNCIESMLSNKILSERRPAHGLMYNEPKQTTAILTSNYLLYLLFYSRVFQRKHDWEICYLSPISQHLLRQNVLNKLPSIYAKYGGEIDLNRKTIHLSTCDFFFMSFVCFPLKIGPLIPRLLTQIYSTHNLEGKTSSSSSLHDASSGLNSGGGSGSGGSSLWHQIVQGVFGAFTSGGGGDTPAKLVLPDNPFKRMHHFYGRIFNFYLQTFVPSNLSPFMPFRLQQQQQHAQQHAQQQQQQLQWLQQQRFYSEYGLKFIEIVGELWFGQSFQERPIGDRCHTLPLMQDLLFRIMEKQVDYQHHYVTTNGRSSSNIATGRGSGSGMPPMHMSFDSFGGGGGIGGHANFSAGGGAGLFGLGKIPSTSCLCPELRTLVRYLYFFLRESFEHFPLDFIAHLRVVIEMWLNVLAPWTIAHKFKNADKFIATQKQSEREVLEQQQQRQNALLRRGGVFAITNLLSKLLPAAMGGGSGSGAGSGGDESGNLEQNAAQQHIQMMLHNLVRWNDDRERKLAYNNTQFSSADALVAYELDGMDASLDLGVWRQYIIEMLPFYSTLVNYFVGALLKYDLGHPLKQLCVLKVLHVYKNPAVASLVKQAENTLFNPYQNSSSGRPPHVPTAAAGGGGDVDVNNLSMDAFGSSEPVYVMNVIQEITYRRLHDYRCLPFLYEDMLQWQEQQQQQHAHGHLYPSTTTTAPQFIDAQQMLQSIQMTRSNAYEVYVKCKKAMTRLCPPKPLQAIKEQTQPQTSPIAIARKERRNEQEQKPEQATRDADDGDGEQKHVGEEYAENIGNHHRNSNSNSGQVQNAIFYALATVLSLIRSVYACFSTYCRNINMSTSASTTASQNMASRPNKYTSSMTYFATPQDNVQIIRYIVGELEELFAITPQQQDDAMNVSIMYEPSQSPLSSRSDDAIPKSQLQQQQQQYAGASAAKTMRMPTDTRLRYAYCQHQTVQLWNRPQGEWEWSFSLNVSRWLYHNLICRIEWLDRVYCAWMAKPHRTYLCDIRVITWLAVLLMSKLFLHHILFYFVFLLFAVVILLSCMHQRGFYAV